VVLYRTEAGDVVALEDRCAHRAYPLSAGELIGDNVRCGLCGFVYGPDGRCVSVPTQPNVPYGAEVASYPVREADGLVWVWLGEPGRAGLHRIPELPWLGDDDWSTVSGEEEVLASFLLLHENFADVTQAPGRSRVLWRVSRDFAVGDSAAGARVAGLFEDYYARVFRAMETAQAVLDTDGPGPEANVAADVAALKVREIVLAMLAEETPVIRTRRARV